MTGMTEMTDAAWMNRVTGMKRKLSRITVMTRVTGMI